MLRGRQCDTRARVRRRAYRTRTPARSASLSSATTSAPSCERRRLVPRSPSRCVADRWPRSGRRTPVVAWTSIGRPCAGSSRRRSMGRRCSPTSSGPRRRSTILGRIERRAHSHICAGCRQAVRDVLPEPVSISVVTIGEPRAGVPRARDRTQRDQRALRLEVVRAAFEPLPVDEHVASKYGELLAWVRDRRRSKKATDLLIAAATDRRLYTLDRRQASLARGAGLAVEIVLAAS